MAQSKKTALKPFLGSDYTPVSTSQVYTEVRELNQKLLTGGFNVLLSAPTGATIKNVAAYTTNALNTLYTVPTGKKFILLSMTLQSKGAGEATVGINGVVNLILYLKTDAGMSECATVNYSNLVVLNAGDFIRYGSDTAGHYAVLSVLGFEVPL